MRCVEAVGEAEPTGSEPPPNGLPENRDELIEPDRPPDDRDEPLVVQPATNAAETTERNGSCAGKKELAAVASLSVPPDIVFRTKS
jgi:hypothetical protein